MSWDALGGGRERFFARDLSQDRQNDFGRTFGDPHGDDCTPWSDLLSDRKERCVFGFDHQGRSRTDRLVAHVSIAVYILCPTMLGNQFQWSEAWKFLWAWFLSFLLTFLVDIVDTIE